MEEGESDEEDDNQVSGDTSGFKHEIHLHHRVNSNAFAQPEQYSRELEGEQVAKYHN